MQKALWADRSGTQLLYLINLWINWYPEIKFISYKVEFNLCLITRSGIKLKIKLEFKVLNLFQFGIELCSISANLFQLSDFLVLLSSHPPTFEEHFLMFFVQEVLAGAWWQELEWELLLVCVEQFGGLGQLEGLSLSQSGLEGYWVLWEQLVGLLVIFVFTQESILVVSVRFPPFEPR